jgi:apolipoprotein N-acyltransferase
LAVLAGIMLPLALAPFDFWWSAFVGILLLISVLQATSLRRSLWRWYLFGLGQYAIGASWLYVSVNTHGGASLLLAGTLVLLFVAGISLVVLAQGYLYQRFFAGSLFGLVGAFPALWFFKEWTTSWLLTGFPWALVGYGHLETPLAGFAPVVGVFGTGYVMVLISALLFAAIQQRRGLYRSFYFGLAALPFLVGFGLSQISFTRPASEPLSVSLIQGNIDQRTKWQRAQIQPIIDRYTDLSESEWGRDLIVWPEASVTLFADRATALFDALDRRGKVSNTGLLLGIPSRDGESFFNSAVALGAGSGTYSKRHLVPFGEYVPLENVLRGAIQFFDLPMSRNRPGPLQQPHLTVGEVPLGLSICYEIAFPNLVRQQAATSGLLVTISNDTWFGASVGPHQHMQMAQMRALENGRYLVRSTNNGITAIVDSGGQITGRLPQFEQGVLRGLVVARSGATPYTLMGDWPMLLGLGLLMAGLMIRRQTGSGTVDAPQSGL